MKDDNLRSGRAHQGDGYSRGRRLAVLLVLLTLQFSHGRPVILVADTIEWAKSDFLAGYIVDYSNTQTSDVDEVVAGWFVPSITTFREGAVLVQWIGIGKADLSELIRVGTIQITTVGSNRYRAFYDVDPEDIGGAIVELDGKVGPGTSIAVVVQKGSGDDWTIAIGAGDSTFVTSVNHRGSRLYAAWLVETETYLPDFGSVLFSGITANVTSVRQNLSDLPNKALVLHDSALACSLASTSEIVASGSFTVTFVQSTCPAAGGNQWFSPVLGLVIVGTLTALGAFVIFKVAKGSSKASSVQVVPPLPYGEGRCANCGSALPPDVKFCISCGAKKL